MMLDSSVLIAYLRGNQSTSALRLVRALEHRERLVLPDIVLMEVLRGARDLSAFRQLEQRLRHFDRFQAADSHVLARRAALLYAVCRWAGFTPRSPNDCLIACCAIEAGEVLLHQDRDFERMATLEPALKLAG